MKKVLVTGGSGFTGQHLIPKLRNSGFETHQLTNAPNASEPFHPIGDVTNFNSLCSALKSLQPDFIIHLAAISFAAHPQPLKLYDVNVLGTENLLRAIDQTKTNIKKVILASSANIYGQCDNTHIAETTCPAPVNHYAASKLAMEHMAKTWMDKLPIIIVRPFNYIGVGQNEKFLIPKIVRHFINKTPTIDLGNTDIARDFTDVRTICEYYLRLLASDNAIGETVNLCSGRLIRFQEIIEHVSEISNHTINVKINPDFVRETDIKNLSGSPKKLYDLIGEQTHRPIKETLRWIFDQTQ